MSDRDKRIEASRRALRWWLISALVDLPPSERPTVRLTKSRLTLPSAQPAPKEPSMQTIVNNIPEPVYVAGSDLIPGDTVEFAVGTGVQHGIVLAGGGSIYCYETNAVQAVAGTESYLRIAVTVTLAPVA